MLDTVENDLPQITQENSEANGDGTHTVVESFMWEGFEVFVTRLCKVTQDYPATYDDPGCYEIDEGEITKIDVRTYDADGPYNLLFARQEVDLPTMLERVFPFSPVSNECEVYLNGE